MQAQLEAVQKQTSYDLAKTKLSGTKGNTIDNRFFGNNNTAIHKIKEAVEQSSANIRKIKRDAPPQSSENRIKLLTRASELAQSARPKARAVVDAAIDRSGLFD